MWKIYKEGQGKWARGTLAFIVAIAAVFTVASLHEALPVRDTWTIPIVNWGFDYRFLIEGPILIAALVFGVWLFNQPRAADFLIDTENELKNKVTWPSKKEEINASVVVVIATFIIGVIILLVDSFFIWVQGKVY
jgi:preprotein translocase subunit SecE